MKHLFSKRLRDAAEPVWEKCHSHPFVTGLGDGSLAADVFIHYLKQDYAYLKDYAKLFALGCVKAGDVATMTFFSELCHSILGEEMALHRQYAERFGVTRAELEEAEPSPITIAYTKYMLDAASRGTLADVVAVLLPCMWSYKEIGAALADRPGARDHPLYAEWIRMYGSASFGEMTDRCIALMDRLTEGLPESELLRLEDHFRLTSRFEYLFWDEAYRQAEWPI